MEPSRAVIEYDDGVYEGYLVDDMMEGQGIYRYTNGDVYIGEFKNDAINGRGRYTWADGTYYDGDYVDGVQQGKGTFKDKCNTYQGDWKGDERDGKGVMIYVDGGIYDGFWRNNLRHGKGKLTTKTEIGDTYYEGDWLNDRREGWGTLSMPNGDCYEGTFEDDEFNGQGSMKWADGSKYVGSFRNGRQHGNGIEHKPNGDFVEGEWLNGSPTSNVQVHHTAPEKEAEQLEQLMDTLKNVSMPIRKNTLSQLDRLDSESNLQNRIGSNANYTPIGDLLMSSSLDMNNYLQLMNSGQQLQYQYNCVSTLSAHTGGLSAPIHYTESDLQGWQKVKVVGKGSFGSVYEAALPNGRTVCVKIVELGSVVDQSDMNKLRNEISLMQRFNHPNIVRYHGSLEDHEKNTLNIFMEYVTGGSLNQYIKKFKKLPLDTIKQWTYQMVCGVTYLHDQSICHRDIKGDNILVTMEGVLKLADFGCSKSIDDVCSKTHGCKTMIGTPYWMAPEVIMCDNKGYGFKSDIWSVGCTIVEMLTGKPPWPECNSMWAAVYKIANSKGLPTEIPKNLDPNLMKFLERCFERDPKKRASAKELLQHPFFCGINGNPS